MSWYNKIKSNLPAQVAGINLENALQAVASPAANAMRSSTDGGPSSQGGSPPPFPSLSPSTPAAAPAPAAAPPAGDNTPMRISLDSASREELVNFVKRQAIAVKKRDEKISELVDAYKRLAKERNDFKAKIEERDKEDEAILNADVGLAPPPPEDDDRPNATDAAESNGADGNDVESELAKQLGSGQENSEQQQSGDDDKTEPSGSVNDARSGDDGGTVYQIDEEEREKEARRKELERQREAAYQARLRELVREGHVLRRTVREAREQAAEKERALVGRVEELEQRVQEQKDLYDTLQTKSGEQIERLATELQRMADSEARAKAEMEARHKEKVDELEGELAKQRDAQKELLEAGQRRIKELNAELEDSHAKAKELGEDLHKAQESLAEREHHLVSLQKDKEVELQGLHDTLILMRNEAQAMGVESAKLKDEIAKWQREAADRAALATELQALKERQGQESDASEQTRQADLNSIADKESRIRELEEVVARLSSAEHAELAERPPTDQGDSEALAAARARIAELESEVEALRNNGQGGGGEQTSDWIAEKSELARQVEELKQTLEAGQQRTSDGAAGAEEAEESRQREREGLDEERRALDEERERLEKEKDETHEERERLQEERERLRADRAELDQLHSQAQAPTDEQAEADTEEKTDDAHQSEALRDETERLRADLRQREEDLTRKREQVVRLKARARELVKKAREDRDRLEKAVHKAEDEQARLGADRQQLGTELEAAQARLAEVERALAQGQEQVEKAMAREREGFRNTLKEVNERHDKSLADKDDALRKLREEKDELIGKVNAAAEEKAHTDETLSKLQEVMMQKDTQYKAVKDNESKLLSLIEMFKKQLKEIEKNSEDKQKKLQEEIKGEVEKRNKLNQRIEEEKEKHKKAVEEMQGMLTEHRLGEEQLGHIKKLMKEADDRHRDALARAERERQEVVDAHERTKAERERDREERGKLQAKIKKLKDLLKLAEKHLGETRQKVAAREEELAGLGLQMDGLRRELEAAAQRVEAERAETEKRVTIEVKAKAREEFLQQLRKAAQVYKEKMKELQGQLAQVTQELEDTKAEFRSYKLRAQSAIASAGPAGDSPSTERSQAASGGEGPTEDEAHSEAPQALSSIVSLQEEVTQLKKEAERLQAENEELRHYEATADALQTELTELQHRHQNEVQEFENVRADMRKRNQEWEERLAEREAEHRRLVEESRHNVLQARRENADKLKELEQRLQTEQESTQAALKEREEREAQLVKEIKILEQRIRLLNGMTGAKPTYASLSSSSSSVAPHSASPSPSVSRSTSSVSLADLDMSAAAAAAAAAAPNKPREDERGLTNNVLYNQMKAAHREELHRLKLELEDLRSALADAERTTKLHLMQEQVLKEEIREFERAQKREGSNIGYLKNIIVKYMETGEHDALLPVISTVLQFTPEEIERINQRRKANSFWGSVWGK